jgi:hypothetical protein
MSAISAGTWEFPRAGDWNVVSLQTRLRILIGLASAWSRAHRIEIT